MIKYLGLLKEDRPKCTGTDEIVMNCDHQKIQKLERYVQNCIN